jgi:hypothetical protein
MKLGVFNIASRHEFRQRTLPPQLGAHRLFGEQKGGPIDWHGAVTVSVFNRNWLLEGPDSSTLDGDSLPTFLQFNLSKARRVV